MAVLEKDVIRKTKASTFDFSLLHGLTVVKTVRSVTLPHV